MEITIDMLGDVFVPGDTPAIVTANVRWLQKQGVSVRWANPHTAVVTCLGANIEHAEAMQTVVDCWEEFGTPPDMSTYHEVIDGEARNLFCAKDFLNDFAYFASDNIVSEIDASEEACSLLLEWCTYDYQDLSDGITVTWRYEHGTYLERDDVLQLYQVASKRFPKADPHNDGRWSHLHRRKDYRD